MKIKLLASILIILAGKCANSQTIVKPNFGMKSHETLEIDSIETDGKTSRISMVIENKTKDGFFCADSNIYVVLPQNKKLKLIATKGIPICPESYHFKTFGEKLKFSLVFPPFPPNIKWIDLIENCDDRCFSFNTIILDNLLNGRIDVAYNLMNGGKNSEAITSFEKIMEEIKTDKMPLEGNMLMNLIFLNLRIGNREKAKVYYENLKNLKTTDSARYLEILKTSGIVF
jgi:hypothetical protein